MASRFMKSQPCDKRGHRDHVELKRRSYLQLSVRVIPVSVDPSV